MNLHKSIALISAISALSISAILAFFVVNNIRQMREPLDLAEIIEQGRADELTL